MADPRFRYILPAVLAAMLLALAPTAGAQSRFDPAVRVNNTVITGYELEQRALLLRALGASGDLAREARERLIEERLQVQDAAQLSVSASEEQITAGIEEFAARGDLSADAFLEFLASRGVARETFIDFVTAGVLWREVARLRFAPRAQVTEEDVDRAVALLGREGGARVLLSEIILPARNADEAALSEAEAARLAEITSFEAFAAAARNLSASGSRDRGGRIDWLSLNDLPPAIRAQLITLAPGEVTEPVRIQNAVAVFQLRALEELPVREAEVVALEYAEFRIPGGDAGDARAVAGRVDTCDDLYGEARRLPEDRLVREVRAPAELPADLRAVLEGLDDNETSIALRRGDTQLLVMLCGRSTAAAEEADRGEIRRQLLNQRVASYAAGYLADLRADAVIVDLR